MKETQPIPNKYHRMMLWAIGIFLCLTTGAMIFYPGGNSLDPSAPGYDFWRNVFSDLGNTITNRNEVNTISLIFFTLAMEEFGIIVIITWNKIPEKNPIFTAKDRRFGTLCGIGLCIIGFTPFNVVPILHAIGVSLWHIGYIGYIKATIMGGTFLILDNCDTLFRDTLSISKLMSIVVFYSDLSKNRRLWIIGISFFNH